MTKFAIAVCNSNKNLGRLAGLVVEDDYVEFRESVISDFNLEMLNLDWNKIHTVLLSCEWLGHKVTDKVEFERIISTLSPYFKTIEALVYLRRQDKLAISRYSTSLKAGNSKPFAVDANLSVYDFDAICTCWSDHVEILSVRLFDRSEFVSNDLLTDFCSAIGVAKSHSTKYVDVESTNMSLSREGQIIMLAFNQYVNSGLHDLSINEVRQLRKEIAKNYAGNYNPSTQSDAEIFLAQFKQSNEAVRQKYFSSKVSLFE